MLLKCYCLATFYLRTLAEDKIDDHCILVPWIAVFETIEKRGHWVRWTASSGRRSEPMGFWEDLTLRVESVILPGLLVADESGKQARSERWKCGYHSMFTGLVCFCDTCDFSATLSLRLCANHELRSLFFIFIFLFKRKLNSICMQRIEEGNQEVSLSPHLPRLPLYFPLPKAVWLCLSVSVSLSLPLSVCLSVFSDSKVEKPQCAKYPWFVLASEPHAELKALPLCTQTSCS